MVYLVAALAQFGVILLTQMAVAAGWILASSAIAIALVTALIVAIHAMIVHFRQKSGGPHDRSGAA